MNVFISRPANSAKFSRPTLPRRWLVVRQGALVAVLLALAATGCNGQQQRNGAAALASLPEAVRAALDRAGQAYSQPLDGVKWTKSHRLTGSDHPLFQIVGVNARGNKVEIEITHAGRIIEVEEIGIPLDEVPEAVLAAIQAKMPDFDAFHVEAIYQSDRSQPVCFGFESEAAAGKRTEVYISPDGKAMN